METPLIEARDLRKYFHTPAGAVRAVDDVSFDICRGEGIGLVGESGCGKSTVGRAILRLIEPSSGELRFDGRDLLTMERSERMRLRKEMGIVFQNPFSSLNPRMKVLDLVGEPLRVHTDLRGKELRGRVIELLDRVGLKGEHLGRFPHQFSGGQRQRIAIARSLALNPAFVVFDEPTSALDVSVQAQVLNLIRGLREQTGLTSLFITHNLHVVRHIAGRVMVMYLGKIMESGPVSKVFERPRHPYTKALLDSVPVADPRARRERNLLEGDVPSPLSPPPGCRFHTRCPRRRSICEETEPRFRPMGDRLAACHYPEEY